MDRKKGQIVKTASVDEVRILTDAEGIKRLIGELTAAYWGCKVRLTAHGACIIDNMTASTLNNVAVDSLITHQIILKPLQDISNENAVEVGKILGNGNLEVDGANYADGKIVIAYSSLPAVSFYVDELNYCAIDFLRASFWNGNPKSAYDLGYGPIKSLIASGIAVDAGKI